MLLTTVNKNKKERVKDSAIKLHNLNNQSSIKFTSSQSSKSQSVNIIIAIVAFLFLLIMILTKLRPCIEVSWTQEFCDRWNDFWFSISASFISASLFYLIFTTIPDRVKRNKIEILINHELGAVLIHLNVMIVLVTNRYYYPIIGKHDFFEETTKKQFIDEFLKLDWEKKHSYFMDGSNQKNAIECIKLEINNAQNKLEQIQHQYGHYLTIEEQAVFNKEILHNRIITDIATITNTQSPNINIKETIASMLFDFYYSLFSFSMRLKKSSDYSW